MTIEIKHRYTGKVLFTSTKTTVREALQEALAAGADLRWADMRRSDLSGSNMSDSDLSYSNLRGSDMRRSDLSGSNMSDSDLSGSDLSYSNLSGSDLSGSDLSYSNLRGSDMRRSDLSGSNMSDSDLSYSNLRGSDLRRSDLSGSNLSGSDLSYSNLSGSTTCLSITGLPSGHAILAPLPEGWRLTVGCWSGTVDELRELIAQDDDWPEATGEQITLRRPMLAALADMCDAWAVAKADVLQAVQDKWGTK